MKTKILDQIRGSEQGIRAGDAAITGRIGEY